MPLPPARSRLSRTFTPLAAAALAIIAPAAAAHAGTHSTLASFQQNVRTNTLLDALAGPADFFLASVAVSGGGYGCTLDCFPDFDLIRFGTVGVGAKNNGFATRVTMTGRPVSAFAATFRAANGGLVSVGGSMTVVTDTGESFTVNAAVGGTFFGFTTSRPFTTVTIDCGFGSPLFEFIDDVHVGISANAPELTDQCSDAETVNPITAVQFPFTTAGIGATAEAIGGSCTGVDTGPDTWLRFVSPVHGDVTINTCGCTFDSILRVFSSCPPAAGTGQIACNDDLCATNIGQIRASQVSFRAEAGEDYLIRVSGFNGLSGSGNLFFSVVPDCRADINHSGGLPTVQDIFDFLSFYFGGCP